MDRRDLTTPAIVVGVVLLAVVLFVDRPVPRAEEPAEPSDPPEPTPSAQLESLSEPDDLSEAEDVAAKFTRALLGGDLDALDALTTSEFSEELIGTQGRAEPVAPDVGAEVDAIIPRDLHLDRVVLQVIIRHTGDPTDRIETMTLSLARTPDGAWRVTDGAI